MLNNVYRMKLFTQFIDSLTFLFFEKSKHRVAGKSIQILEINSIEIVIQKV